MTTLEQLHYVKKGLKLKDVFVLFYLKKLKSPTTLKSFLKLNPLLDLTDKNLRLSINKLEKENLLVKFKTSTTLLFIFPFLCSVKKTRRLKPMPYQKLTKSKFMLGQNRPLGFYKYNYINNIYKLKRHNVKNIKSNINTHYYDDVNTSNINNIKQSLSKLYGFKPTPSEKSQIEEQHNSVVIKNNLYDFEEEYKPVVTKSNFNFLAEIKKKFKREFPHKNSFIDCLIPINFNYELFISKIKASKFLREKNNLGLTWLIKRYDSIINDCYTDFKERTENQGFKTKETEIIPSEREYTREYLNSLFDDLSDIELPEA